MRETKTSVIPADLLDQLLSGVDAKEAFARDGLFDALKKALAERVLNAEMDHHLASEAEEGRPNRRNGTGRKTVLTDTGAVEIAVPRDREGRFDPQLIARYKRVRAAIDPPDRLLHALTPASMRRSSRCTPAA
jgi:putative transposase